VSNICETRRVVVRPLTLDDAPFIWELLNDPDFIANIGDRGVRTVDDACGYLTRGPMAMYARLGFGLWCVELRATQTPIGICGLLQRDWLDDMDLGFAFLPAFRGTGYAFEAASAVLAYALDTLAASRVTAIVSPHNTKSVVLLGRLGMEPCGMVRAPDATQDVQLFAIAAG